MLIAYLDEFGHQGPYVDKDHKKYNTHPLFGYGGYVIDSDKVRELGGYFEHIKEKLLAWEIEQSGCHPRRWEKKGSSLLTTKNMDKFGSEITPALGRIYRRLFRLNGKVFFFGQEKPIGPVSVTREKSQEREEHCLIQSLQRLGRLANDQQEEMLVIMDATETDNRERAVSTAGRTIYSGDPETRQIIEVPIQADSYLYGTIQLADWTCALLSRLGKYHFANEVQFEWSVGLANTLFTGQQNIVSNSVIWTNDLDRNTKCYPSSLLHHGSFSAYREEKRSRIAFQNDRNKQMQNRMIDAGSAEFKAKLASIRRGRES